MDRFRKKMYEEYPSTHTKHLYEPKANNQTRGRSTVLNQYFFRHLPQDLEIDILDLGCGEGELLRYLDTRGYKNCYGIDHSKEQVELARESGLSNVQEYDVFEFLRSKEDSYNVIFAKDILEHFNKEELLDIFELVSKSLKRGGLFIIQVPNGESPFVNRYLYSDITHESYFTESSLSQMFRAVNFNTFHFYESGPVAHSFKSLVRFILWRIITLGLKIYLLIETGGSKGIFTQNIIGVAEK